MPLEAKSLPIISAGALNLILYASPIFGSYYGVSILSHQPRCEIEIIYEFPCNWVKLILGGSRSAPSSAISTDSQVSKLCIKLHTTWWYQQNFGTNLGRSL